MNDEWSDNKINGWDFRLFSHWSDRVSFGN